MIVSIPLTVLMNAMCYFIQDESLCIVINELSTQWAIIGPPGPVSLAFPSCSLL